MISLCILMCYLIPVSFQEHVPYPYLFIRYYTNTRRDRHPQRIGYMLQGSKLVTLCDLRSCTSCHDRKPISTSFDQVPAGFVYTTGFV